MPGMMPRSPGGGTGGSTMTFYRGAFATPEELKAAHPTDIVGAFAIVLSTGTFWIWDGRWVDTGALATELGIGEAPADGKIYGRRDKTWTEVVSGGGGGGTGNHDELENVRVDGDDPLGAWHLTESTARWAENAANRRPQKPQNLSPENGAVGISQFARFVGSTYYQRDGITMRGMRLRIATDAAMTDIVFEVWQDGTSTTYILSGGEIADGEKQYWFDLTYRTVEMIDSEPSEPTMFKTQQVFAPSGVKQPILLAPLEDGMIPDIYALLMSDNFETWGDADIHKSSDWQISGTRDFSTPTLWERMDSATDLTAAITDISLYGLSSVYARCRHEGQTHGKSLWSPVNRAIIRPHYGLPLIGIEIQTIGLNSVIRYIDEAGNYVNPHRNYFATHPLFAPINNLQLVEDQHMALYPAGYVRSDPANTGTKIRLWISPQPFEGAHLHPAFRMSPSGFLRARYVGSNATLGVSVPGVAWNYQVIADTAIANTAKRNVGGVSGWHIETPYEIAWDSLLKLIEGRNFNLGIPFGSESIWARPGDMVDAAGWSAWRGIKGDWFLGYNAASTYVTLRRALQSAKIGGTTTELCLPDNLAILHTLPTSIETVGSGAYYYVSELRTGRDDILDADLDYLFLPKKVSRYAATTNGPFNMAVDPNGWGASTTTYPNTVYRSGNTIGLPPGAGYITIHRIAKWM